jgi:putative SOS response-associated peptidase YedK
MCSEFEQDQNPADLVIRFELIEFPPQINMAFFRPTDQALVIGMNKQPMIADWGFEVDWDTKPLINARSETLTEKKSFQPHLETRCIVPATGYSEWRKKDGKKLKNSIYPSDQPLFSMAGLIKNNTFTIITCQPSPEIAHIHNRMPVVLTPEGEKSWLHPSNTFKTSSQHLAPYDRGQMTANEDQPLPPRQGSLFG